MRKQTKSINRILITMIVAVLLGVMMVMPAFAKTKTIKPKNQSFTTSLSVAAKKATTVKKGTYLVKSPSKEDCYMKFTAPKTKTYTFTIKNQKPKTAGAYANGFFRIMTVSPYNSSSITSAVVKTNDGKRSSGLFFNCRDNHGSFLLSRYAKIKLTAGQTAYIYVTAHAGSTYNLIIK